jgi:hypothetical protein
VHHAATRTQSVRVAATYLRTLHGKQQSGFRRYRRAIIKTGIPFHSIPGCKYSAMDSPQPFRGSRR